METFTFVPSYSSDVTAEPGVDTVSYGEGYQQRRAKGINNNPLAFNLMFTGTTDVDRNALIAFLTARGGVEAFIWAPPAPHYDPAVPKYFICPKWTNSYIEVNNNSISVPLVQTFSF